MEILVVQIIEEDEFLLENFDLISIGLILKDISNRVAGEGEEEAMEFVTDNDDFMVEWIAPCEIAVLVGDFDHQL